MVVQLRLTYNMNNKNPSLIDISYLSNDNSVRTRVVPSRLIIA